MMFLKDNPHNTKSVNGNSARRLDHCDATASRRMFGVPHNEVELQTEFKLIYSNSFGINRNQHTN